MKGPGLSYEIFGYMNCCGVQNRAAWTVRFGVQRDGILKTESTVSGYIHQNRTFGLKNQIVAPSDIWLIKEQDVNFAGARNNYPDETDNHGKSGENILMVDGHVEWIRVSEYEYRYELGQDEGLSPGRPSKND